MKVILFGASGLVGQGALRECLRDPGVTHVLAAVRAPLGLRDPKLEEWTPADWHDFSADADRLTGYDACLFCLGVSSAGMKEAAYRRITHGLTLAAARVLAERNPGMAFVYVSGAHTDSTEKGRSMWARVKGQTENELLRLFPRAFMARPGYIHPAHGERSRTPLYNALMPFFKPLYPLAKRFLPHLVITTEELGRAMLRAAREGAPKRVLEIPDLAALGSCARPSAE